MAYTDIDNPELYFQTKLYTGTGSSNAITLDGSENMQPDLVYIKSRNQSGYNPNFTDSVRGATKIIWSNRNTAENTYADSLTSFNSDGFTIGADTANGEQNLSGESYVAWNWKAGTSFSNDASATSVGTIDSTGSVSDTAGFSIVSYTGTGSAGTIKHGLSTVPKMIITKKRSASQGWHVQHASLGATKELYLNTTDAAATGSTPWNDTTPTSSVFSVGTSGGTNGSSATYIAYCFAEKKGYSKFGSHIGNGNADGTFVYTGFRPAWIMFKGSSAGGNHWQIYDTKRNTFNVVDDLLRANLSNAENTNDADESIDIVSNGFKCRGTSNNNNNHSGVTYIYMAFAEQPFVNSNGIPNNAR